jgi:hypothetical protein
MPDRFGPWSTLSCPSCGGEFTHQGKVEVFFDNDHTGEKRRVVHATVTRENRVSNTNMDDNPSPRRDGVLIHFTCELCTAQPVLAIFQHKGSTYLAWRDPAESVSIQED